MSRFRAAASTLFLAWFVASAPCSALTPPKHVVPYGATEIDTQSGVRLMSFDLIGNRMREIGRSELLLTQACVSFVNTTPRVIREITFHFVYYDKLNNHGAENDLVRAGRFSPGVMIDGVDAKSGEGNSEDCVRLPFHDRDLARIVTYVTSVTYDDGTTWDAADLTLPAHIGH